MKEVEISHTCYYDREDVLDGKARLKEIQIFFANDLDVAVNEHLLHLIRHLAKNEKLLEELKRVV